MDEQGTSPLWTAADHGNLEIVKILVKAGADCDKVNKRLGGLNLKIWLCQVCPKMGAAPKWVFLLWYMMINRVGGTMFSDKPVFWLCKDKGR